MKQYGLKGFTFRNGSPNLALGLGKFKPHDFHAKNARINRFKQKKSILAQKSHKITSGPTLYVVSFGIMTCKRK